jgi:hypothetical protein
MSEEHRSSTTGQQVGSVFDDKPTREFDSTAHADSGATEKSA